MLERQRQSYGGVQQVSDSEELLHSRWGYPGPIPGEIQQTDAKKEQVRCGEKQCCCFL